MSGRRAVVDNPPPSERVLAEWQNRVIAEYTSAATTHELTFWLLQMGASPDLIRAGLAIVDDELVHAELSFAVCEAAGAAGMQPIGRELLVWPKQFAELEWNALMVATQVFALGETIAVPLFTALRKNCSVPVARKALDRILRDEVRHRDFGWTLLEWFLGLPESSSYRAWVEKSLPGLFTELHKNYGRGLKDGWQGVDDAERAWGILPAAEYTAVLEDAWQREFAPRFSRLGIDAQPAWVASCSAISHDATQ